MENQISLNAENSLLVKKIKSSSMEDLSFMRNLNAQDITKAKERIEWLNKENENHKTELVKLGEVKKLLTQLKNSKMLDKKDFILNTINTAISDVFFDQNVKIDLVASNSNQESSQINMKYDIVIFQNGLEMARNEKLLIKNGGGILSFISILFKILVGYLYSRNKFYIFDESLAEVSPQYRPRMAQFLQKFCEVQGFTIIVLTQTEDIAEHADLVYQLDGEEENGIQVLKIDSIVGEYPTENYIYSKIENFQSIKKIEFRYKGFTAIIGRNNIGKSASFRAVDSIIFNSFDMKEYPRMHSAEKPNKLLPTRIEFGKFHTEGDPQNEITKIAMYKKGTSLIYEFNGDTFVGKNLAFEKVKEKVESIGFKYLRLKEQYKNFKGNLKDQTERLAITTQQDSYYLIGAKTSETSKVFDFLFDSREVTMALINLNGDILNHEQALNNNTLEISILNRNIKFFNQKNLLITNIYNQKLIDTICHLGMDVELLERKLFTGGKLISLYDKLLNLGSIIYSINNQKLEIDSSNEIIKDKKILIDKIDQYLSLCNKILIIEEIIKTKNNIMKIEANSKLNYIKLQISSINVIVSLNNIIGLHNNRIFVCHRKLNIIDRLIYLNQAIFLLTSYFETMDKKIKFENREQKLIKKHGLINSLIEKITSVFSLTNLVDNIKTMDAHMLKLNNIFQKNSMSLKLFDVSIKRYELQKLIDSIGELTNWIKNENSTYHDKKLYLENLPRYFNLSECPNCAGLGLTKCEGGSHA